MQQSSKKDDVNYDVSAIKNTRQKKSKHFLLVWRHYMTDIVL